MTIFEKCPFCGDVLDGSERNWHCTCGAFRRD